MFLIKYYFGYHHKTSFFREIVNIPLRLWAWLVLLLGHISCVSSEQSPPWNQRRLLSICLHHDMRITSKQHCRELYRKRFSVVKKMVQDYTWLNCVVSFSKEDLNSIFFYIHRLKKSWISRHQTYLLSLTLYLVPLPFYCYLYLYSNLKMN